LSGIGIDAELEGFDHFHAYNCIIILVKEQQNLSFGLSFAC